MKYIDNYNEYFINFNKKNIFKINYKIYNITKNIKILSFYLFLINLKKNNINN